MTQKKKEIREEQITKDLGGLEALQKIVEGNIECAFRIGKDDILYVDEEGLLKDKHYGFFYLGAPQNNYAGNGVLAGLDRDGDAADCTISLEKVKNSVMFL